MLQLKNTPGFAGDNLVMTRPQHKQGSLNLSQFVARQYGRKRWASLYRFRAHGMENAVF